MPRSRRQFAGAAVLASLALATAASAAQDAPEVRSGTVKDGWMREGMTQNRLAILPGRTHYEMGIAPELVPTALPFLDGTEAVPVWTEGTK
jgi:hypothetical protein